ncbi:MAG: putative aminohydrolase SsnA [Promethearchaeota archaeon]
MNLFIKNGYVLTLNQYNQVISNGGILISDDKIQEINPSSEIENKYSDIDKIIDAKGRIVMPGFICAHMHFYSTFACGMPLPPFPKGFVNVLENLWWKLDKALRKEEIYYSALLGYIEAVQNGTTTMIDHHASPSFVTGSLNEIEKAARELGVRSSLCYEVTDRNGHEEAEEGLKENRRFIEKCQKSNDDMMQGLVGLHASFTLEPETMEGAQAIVEDLNSGVHIHVAEGKADMEDARRKYNMTVIERLKKYQLLNPKTVLAHCIHIEDKDYKIIKESKPNISHQPRSNMNNAVGCMNIFKFKEHEIPVGLGTDGMSTDMKDELIVANLIHKHVQQDNTIGTMEVYEALFKVNPQIVKNVMDVNTGSLVVGKKADIVVTDYYPKSQINSNNVLGHIMFGVLNASIATTIINGRICMEEHQIPGIDLKTVSDKCQQLAIKIWDRI